MGSIAIGADLEIAEAFTARGIPWCAVLPWRLDGFEADAAEPDRARVRDAAGRASSIEVVESSALSANDAFLEAGLRVVEECDVLLAVWDGQPARGKGGTGDVVALATARGKPVVRIDPETGRVEWPDSLPAIGDAAPMRTRADVAARFDALDEAADRAARPARNLLLRIILLHLLASAFIVVALALYPELKAIGDGGKLAAKVVMYSATGLEVCALVVSVYLALKHRRPHHRWLDDRSAAELCRSYLAVWGMPRWAVRPPRNPLAGQASIRRELEVAWRLAASEPIELDDAKSRYAEGDRAVPGSGRIKGQIAYFSGKATRSQRRSRALHHAATTCTVLAVLIGVLAIVLMATGHAKGVGYALVKGVGVALPLVSAALFSFVTANDHSRRSARYREVAANLEDLAEQIKIAATWHEFGRLVDEVEATLLAENAEWHAFQRFAGEPHA
ncbi:MAG: SLATT domain-containing protein [Phycisphaerales bacterium]